MSVRAKKSVRFAALAAVAGMSGFLAGRADAATKTWTGLGANDSIGTGANWNGNTAPVLTAGSGTTADDWIFTGSNRLAPLFNVWNGTNSSNLAQSITFDANARSFTLTPDGSTNFAQLGTTAIEKKIRVPNSCGSLIGARICMCHNSLHKRKPMTNCILRKWLSKVCIEYSADFSSGRTQPAIAAVYATFSCSSGYRC